jgi:Ca2+-binding RTX toxin-like protein
MRNRIVLSAVALGTLVVTTAAPGGAGGGARCFGKPATIIGTNGPDDLRGTTGADVIVGRGGSDEIFGRGGRDRLCGNGDRDGISGGPKADRISGGAQSDLLEGDDQSDLHVGGPGADAIFADELGNAAASDIAKGNAGDDFIDIADGIGNDTAVGGADLDDCESDAGDTVRGCEVTGA